MFDYVFYLISLQILVFTMCISMQAGDKATSGSRCSTFSLPHEVA
jgi:hypothetical protein